MKIQYGLVSSFLGGIDLKLGVSVISLFGVLNKVAGIYGILAVFTGGAEGIALTMYLYSIATLPLYIWGIKHIRKEDGDKSLIYAHMYSLDHFLSSVFTGHFAVNWYVYTPHDGQRMVNSAAQLEMVGSTDRDEEVVKAAAQLVWKSERAFSAGVILFAWFVKIYFMICLYSYAYHLRRGSYPVLPKSRASISRSNSLSQSTAPYQHLSSMSLSDTPKIEQILQRLSTEQQL